MRQPAAKPEDLLPVFRCAYHFGDATEMVLRVHEGAFGCTDALFATVGGKRVSTAKETPPLAASQGAAK